MRRPNARKPESREFTATFPSSHRPPESVDELVLHGDISSLKDAFVARPRCLVTCPVSDSIYQKLQKHPGGISGFYEEAVASFDGNLVSLVNAAVAFVEARRCNAGLAPPRNASGRILPSTFTKIQKIEDALSDIRGMSRAKILAGLIQLLIEQHT